MKYYDQGMLDKCIMEYPLMLDRGERNFGMLKRILMLDKKDTTQVCNFGGLGKEPLEKMLCILQDVEGTEVYTDKIKELLNDRI